MFRRTIILSLMAALVLLTSGISSALAADKTDSLGEQRSKVTPSGLQVEINQVLRQYPGGIQISPTEITWNGGAIAMVFPLPGSDRVSTSSTGPDGMKLDGNVHGCPYGNFTHWWCFYKDKDFKGRMVMYKDCYTQNFASTFKNEATGWVNTSDNHIYAHAKDGGHGDILWYEDGHTQNSEVAPHANDRANSFTCFKH